MKDRNVLFIVHFVEIVNQFFDNGMGNPLGFPYFVGFSVWGAGSTLGSFRFCHGNIMLLVFGVGTLEMLPCGLLDVHKV